MSGLRQFCAVLAFVAALATAPALAVQDVSIIQHLSFGGFILKNNNAQYSLTVTANGVTTYPPEMTMMTPAVNGIYQLSGFNPNADLSLMLNPTSVQLSCSCSGPHLIIDNFDIQPAIPHTDPGGNATIKVGARLRNDGTNAPYGPGNFSGTLSIIVNN